MTGFKVLGWLLIVGFGFWLGFSLNRYQLLRPAPGTFQSSSGFESGAVLPASESQPHLNQARARMIDINSHGRAFSLADNIAAWLGFLSTAAVTLILGYFGRPAPAAGGAPNVAGLSPGATRAIGLLAAFAAVLTAGGAMARSQSKDDYQKADSARTAINTAITDLGNAKTEQEARDVLSKLDLDIGRL